MGLMSARDEPLYGEADGALLSAETLDALGLHHQPFLHEAPVDARFVDDAMAAQLDDVRQALIAGDDLLLVLGPPGSGRSVLLDILNDDSGSRIQCFHVGGSERFSTNNLFAGMLEAFKQPPPDDLKLALDELIPCLQGMEERNTLCVVIVDDADSVDDAELTRLLSSMLYLNSGNETLLRMVFAASEDFEERIPDLLPEGADLPYSILGMEPLEDERAARFLAYRLEQAGHEDLLPFDDEDVTALNDRAGGRPGTLQSLAAERLNERFGGLPPALADDPLADNGLPVADEHRRKLILGGVAALLILAGLLLFLRSPDDDAGQEQASTDQATAELEAENAERLRLVRERANENRARELAAEEAAAARAEAEALAQADAADAASAERNESAGEAADNRPAPADRSARTPATDRPAGDATTDDQPASAGAERSADAAADPPNAAATAADTATGTSTDTGTDSDSGIGTGTGTDSPRSADSPPTDRDTAAGGDRPRGTADAADEAAPAAGSLSAEELAADAPRDGGNRQPARPNQTAGSSGADTPTAGPAGGGTAAAAGNTASPGSSVASSLESPNWILVQSPDQFTIQMIAGVDRQSVDTFLRRSDLPSPNSVFSFERNGTVWHAMVHGLYPTVDAAAAAIEAMPEDLRRYEPWIRSIGRLQQTVRNQNR